MSGPRNAEKRRAGGAIRVPFVRRCRIDYDGGESVSAFIVNINVLGAYVEMTSMPALGRELACRFQAPGHEGEIVVEPFLPSELTPELLAERRRLAASEKILPRYLLSPDEKTLYVANTLGDAVIAFDVQADGTVRNRRDFAKLAGVTRSEAAVRSGADGLAVDEAGRLYVATQVGVQVFSAQGQALGTIPIGVTGGPQNLAFAGPDKKTLYVVGRGAMWKIAMQAQGYKGRAK